MSFNFYHTPGAHQRAQVVAPGWLFNHHKVYVSPEPPSGKEKPRVVVDEHKYRSLDPEQKAMGHYGKSKYESIGGQDFFQMSDRGHGRGLTQADMAKIEAAMEMGLDPNDPELFAEIEKPGARQVAQQRYGPALEAAALAEREFVLPEGAILRLLCNPDERECIFLAAKAKSGKSYISGQYMESYRQIFPEDHPILIFTPSPDDVAYANIKDMECPNVHDPDLPAKILANEYKDMLVCFDDIESLEGTDKANYAALHALRARCLEIGRKQNVYVVNTSHHLMNHTKTKHSSNSLCCCCVSCYAADTEATAVILFPKSGDHCKFELCALLIAPQTT